MWKKRIGIALLSTSILLGACSNDTTEKKIDETKEVEKVFEASQTSAYDAVVSYTGMIYFGEGSYKEFTQLYADPTQAPSESTFENFRSISKPAERFGATDLASFKENLKVEEVDETNAAVYNIMNKEDEIEAATQKWNIVLKDDKWYLAAE